MGLTTTRSHESIASALYTVWLERRDKGQAPAFTVRHQESRAVAYGPTDNSIAATRACERLNAGLMTPNKSHRKAGNP